jgi:hypothetical protein
MRPCAQKTVQLQERERHGLPEVIQVCGNDNDRLQP